MAIRRATKLACVILESRLAASAQDIAALPVVARTLAAASITCPVLVHFTFDEPLLQNGEMRTLVTYHLADSSQCHAGGVRDEVRGCCLVSYIPGGAMTLTDADAEAFIVGDDDDSARPPYSRSRPAATTDKRSARPIIGEIVRDFTARRWAARTGDHQ